MESSFTIPTIPIIPELLRLICENIERKSTLAAVSRTCKAFERPALDVLWYKLKSFYPLAKCLPSHLWTEVVRGDKKTIVLQHPLTPGDCRRLLHYAEKVHLYEYRDDSLFKKRQIDVTVLQGIQLSLEGVKLMPNLQSLTWSSEKDGPDSLPYIHMFLGPRLQSIDFTCRSKSSVPVSLFPSLCQQYPSLRRVSFKIYSVRNGSNVVVEKESIELISRCLINPTTWQNLESLEVPHISYEALLRLSHLPTFQKLRLQRWIPGSVNMTNARSGGFPALKEIEVSVLNAPEVIPVFAMMNSTPLERISVIILKTQSANDYLRLFTAISEHCRHESLKGCYTNDGLWDKHVPNLPPGEPVNFQSIKPMLAFRNLTSFSVEPTRGYYFSSPSLTKEMASSWTKIREISLEIPFGRRSQMQSTITLDDLIPFAEHCPRLKYLAIPFDATDPPELDDYKPGNGVSQTTLTKLFVLDSSAKYQILVAAFLSSLFPTLEEIETVETREFGDSDEDQRGEEEIGEREKIWKAVDDLLWAFSAVRRQERLSLIQK